MSFLKKQLFTGFAPNMMREDLWDALRFLCLPWTWKHLREGDDVEKLEQELGSYLSLPYVQSFDSGRSSLLYALKALGVGHGDEVIVQAYTCIVVTNAILWSGATPVYVDVDEHGNMDVSSFETKITAHTKAVIIQHTFGKAADVEAILRVTKAQGIKTIEDCAHALGTRYQGKMTGTFADIAMFTFGSDKNISSVRGGALATKDEALYKRFQMFHDRLGIPDMITIFRHLLTYPLFSVGKKCYAIGGKYMLWLAKRWYVTPRIISNQEKKGKQVLHFPAQFANVFAHIARRQLRDLDARNQHRQAIALQYARAFGKEASVQKMIDEGHVYLRYLLRVQHPKKLMAMAKKRGIILGNWYHNIIDPIDIDMQVTQYRSGDCPQAEQLAAQSVNLPTNHFIQKEDADRIIAVVRAYQKEYENNL